MDELIQAMSIDELEKFKAQYKNNESVTKILDGYIESKVKEQAQVKARQDFESVIVKTIGKLPHPEDVHNIYIAWRDVEEPDGEPELVGVDEKGTPNGLEITPEIVEAFANLETTPNIDEITQVGDNYLVLRQALKKVSKWVVELNKAFKVSSTGTSSPSTSKRAITVYKRNGTQLEHQGNFSSGNKACEHLGLILGGDSSTRVLARNGYITEAFNGDGELTA